jgi:hypothetical protein
MLYLYGIIDQHNPPPLPLLGLEDAAPGIIPYAGLSAVTGQISCDVPESNVDNVRRHMGVLESLMERCTVLPVRFGSVFSARKELDDYIFRSHETLIADLKRLRGQIEIGVHILDHRPIVPAGKSEPAWGLCMTSEAPLGPGARYLTKKSVEATHRVDQERAMFTLGAAIVEPLSRLATAHTWRTLPSASGMPEVSLALLLRKDQLDAFRLALAEFRGSMPWLEILCTGPWPPYSHMSSD